jgi:hypothetical protein
VRKLYTLAYPSLSDADLKFIQEFRDQHDARYRDVVAPHFTMVFACTSIGEDEYLEHVEGVARRCTFVEFHCRYAMVGADDHDETAYVFLVPDEGYGAVSLLHDQLYTRVLAPYLRLDIPYIPHITIGTLDDRAAAKRLCDDLNNRPVTISGSIDALTVGALDDNKIRNLASFALSR